MAGACSFFGIVFETLSREGLWPFDFNDASPSRLAAAEPEQAWPWTVGGTAWGWSHEPIPEDVLPGYDGDKPLFVGHYWLTGTPQRLTIYITCLDYSIAASHDHSGGHGKLCAYRWEGEQELRNDRLIWVDG